MKICFLNIYSGQVARGAEAFVEEVANRLSKNNQVTVVQGGQALGREKYNVYLSKYDINRKKIHTDIKKTLNQKIRNFLEDYLSLHILIFTIRVIPFLLKEKPEIVIPINGRWQSPLLRIFTWIFGGKMVISGQSGIGRDDIFNLWCLPDSFIALTTFTRNWAKGVNPWIKIVVIPDGVDIGRFKSEGTKMEIDLPRPIILNVSALVSMKRQKLAIKAVSKLKNGSLLLVGLGEMKGELQTMANELLPGRFMILESSYMDIDKVYRSANIFTFPTSAWEGLGIVQLEAMATGLPVVANDDPIRREIVGNAGLFIDPENTEEYANALDKALITDWGDRPRKQAEKFSWDKIAKQYEELFESII